eukprot:2156804-Rhodomonas_salina.2
MADAHTTCAPASGYLYRMRGQHANPAKEQSRSAFAPVLCDARRQHTAPLNLPGCAPRMLPLERCGPAPPSHLVPPSLGTEIYSPPRNQFVCLAMPYHCYYQPLLTWCVMMDAAVGHLGACLRLFLVTSSFASRIRVGFWYQLDCVICHQVAHPLDWTLALPSCPRQLLLIPPARPRIASSCVS